MTPEDRKVDATLFVTFTTLAWIAVALRIFSRRVTKLQLLWDDWLLLVAMVFSLLLLIAMMRALHYGLGEHINYFHKDDGSWSKKLEMLLEWMFCGELSYAIEVALIKCSILCLYLRLFSINRKFVKMCYGMLAIVVAIGFCTFFLVILQAIPVRLAWRVDPHAHRVNSLGFAIGTNLPNILADMIIVAMPIALVWRLYLPLSRRIGLCVVFCLALVATGISCMRFAANLQIYELDLTYYALPVSLYSILETSIGIICACIPSLVPLYRILTGRRSDSNDMTSKLKVSGFDSAGNKLGIHNFPELENGSDKGQLWHPGTARSTRHFDVTGGPGTEDIPMGQIKVRTSIEVSDTNLE